MEKTWLKYYHHDVPAEIDFEKITLSEALARTAQSFPDNPGLLFEGTTVTFRQLDDMVSRFASGLIALGVSPGDKVALLLPNLVQTVVAIYGTFRAGAVVAMNNPLYTDRELEHQYNDSGSTFLVCLDVLLPRMINLRQKTGIKKIISCHIRDFLPFPSQATLSICQKKYAPQDPSGYRCARIHGPHQEVSTCYRSPEAEMGEHCCAAIYRRYNWCVKRRRADPCKSVM